MSRRRLIHDVHRAPGYADVVLADKPVAYLPLNETSGTTAQDRGPNGLDFTYTGSYTLGGDGPDGGASVLTSTTGHVERANSSAFDFGPAVTLEAWAKRSATGSFMAIVSLGDGHAYIRFNSNNTVGFLRARLTAYGSSTTAVTGSGWRHIVVTSDGSSSLRFYLDGVPDGVLSPGGLSNISNSVGATKAIGASYQPTVAERNATNFAHVGIYDYALSADRVKAHYDAMVKLGVS